jgi:hypothetical protein
MKKADLEKIKGSSINDRMRQAPTPGRFGRDSSSIPDRRERRKLDQAQGLVPFAVKLNGELVKQIHARAQEDGTGLNEVVAELLKKGLAA